MKILGLLVVSVLLVGCTTASTTTGASAPATVAAAPPPTAVVVTPQPAPTGRYSGTVWTWDAERNIVTFYDSGKTFRVLTTPDQIARLDLHATRSVTGQLLAPDNIGSVLVMGGPMTAVPNGPASTTEITGQVAAIEAGNVASIQSARGPLRVWVADGAQSRFSAGRPVKVHVTVQPVRMVAVSGTGGQASGPTLAVPPPVPGDSAVAVGRVLSLTPAGALTVESSRGPISVWVPDAANFRVGDFVQVQTIVASN
jgi:hypothetical protein